ncbi:(2Fe-2S)-binding protein [Streptomyces aidingensis]|uniref:Bacterioferritin-associated ferredoxin n=1 Tax=Streptomyces aidingensis TaxID=910347 RepID=A0A1I1LPC2_9ACTN|nr:(2Fe-2S)-binding protein [Streptomyces aidingensis]SFC72808.1 BFD-like [2Fe-2S] binding domain-containing protein [Streptomyces aidingensis]
MYVCSCFGVTEQQVREHAEAGACTPRQIASVCRAGTDCGSCVRRIQGLLGRGDCPRREVLRQQFATGPAGDPAGDRTGTAAGRVEPAVPAAV